MLGPSIGVTSPFIGLSVWASPEVGLLAVEILPDRTLAISADLKLLTINVSEPMSWSGTYTVNPVDFASGPLNLVPPLIPEQTESGSSLMLIAGLWIYDGAFGVPQVQYTWSEDGIEGPETTLQTYAPTTGGKFVGVRETLMQIGGRFRSANSAAITTI